MGTNQCIPILGSKVIVHSAQQAKNLMFYNVLEQEKHMKCKEPFKIARQQGNYKIH